MSAAFAESVEHLIRQREFLKAVEAVQAWLATAKKGEPDQMLAELPQESRVRMASLIRDALTRTSNTVLMACPMLLFGVADDQEDQMASDFYRLPSIHPSSPWASTNLKFCGWAHSSTQLPITLQAPNASNVGIRLNDFDSAVAIFRAKAFVADSDVVVINDKWWADLFGRFNGLLKASASALLPLPDALEASRVMKAVASHSSSYAKNAFLSADAWSWACSEAILFRNTCYEQFGKKQP